MHQNQILNGLQRSYMVNGLGRPYYTIQNLIRYWFRWCWKVFWDHPLHMYGLRRLSRPSKICVWCINWFAISMFQTPLITIRKRSCRKVMFLHLSVSHSVHRGCVSQHAFGADTPPPADLPLGRNPTPLSRHTPLLPDGHCCGRYASYWNAFLFQTPNT